MPTRAQIINHMLATIGEAGVSNEMSLHPSVQLCSKVLDLADLEFQGRGWWFNREHQFPLVPDNRGEIIIPTNALDVTVQNVESFSPVDKVRYTARDRKLYDNLNHTFEIGQTVYALLVLQLPIESLPTLAAAYLMNRAAEDVFSSEDGEEKKMNKLERRTALAWQSLKAAEMRNVAVNALDGSFNQRLQAGWRATGQARNPRFIGGRGF